LRTPALPSLLSSDGDLTMTPVLAIFFFRDTAGLGVFVLLVQLLNLYLLSRWVLHGCSSSRLLIDANFSFHSFPLLCFVLSKFPAGVSYAWAPAQSYLVSLDANRFVSRLSPPSGLFCGCPTWEKQSPLRNKAHNRRHSPIKLRRPRFFLPQLLQPLISDRGLPFPSFGPPCL